MNKDAKQKFIHRIALENQTSFEGRKILWSRHAIAELANERWTRSPVEAGLLKCQVIEEYPVRNRPLPDCLVLGWLDTGQPFHSVVAIDEPQDRLLIVTVYQPSSEEWENDWRTRK